MVNARRFGCLAVLIAALAVATGCGELGAARNADESPTAKVAPGETLDIPTVSNPDNVYDVGFDVSLSNEAERTALLGFFVQVVLPHAFEERATLVVHLVGARSFNSGTAVDVFDFDAAMNEELATPNQVLSESGNRLTKAVMRALAAEPEPASDPVGFLRRVADTKSQWPNAHVIGVYLGDGAQSTPTCDLGLSAISDENSMEATAAACIGQHDLKLNGVKFWLLGTGLAVGGDGMNESQALDTIGFLTYVINALGHGEVTCQSVAPLPGTCS